MSIRLLFAGLVAFLVFLGYFIFSGDYKLIEPDEPQQTVNKNETPEQVFREYIEVVKQAASAKELLPYHKKFVTGELESRYGSAEAFLSHEKKYFRMRNIKLIDSNMKFKTDRKWLAYSAWHIASGNHITGRVTLIRQNNQWVIDSHRNEIKNRD